MTIKIVAATLTTKELEMITDSGDSITLPQGHPKVSLLIEKILPVTALGKIAVISLEDLKSHAVYEDFERKTGWLIKIFRMIKNKVTNLFGHIEEIYVDLGEEEKTIQEIMDEAVQELRGDEPMDVAEEEAVEQASAIKVKEIKKMTRSEEIRMLIEQHKSEINPITRNDILQNLLDLKQVSKKSWEYHGVSKQDAKRITELAKL